MGRYASAHSAKRKKQALFSMERSGIQQYMQTENLSGTDGNPPGSRSLDPAFRGIFSENNQ